MKIFSQTPSRISLFGGGTDVEPYASTYGGLCINIAINIRQKITLYSEEDLYEHPYITVPPLGKKEFYYTILDEFGLNDMHISSIKGESDGILESGLGNSASATVALIGAINKRMQLNLSLYDIAMKAWDIEVNKLGLFGGKQDQFAATYGGVNVIFFEKEVKVNQMSPIWIKSLIPALVLFYVGENRKSAKIQEGFKDLTISQIEALNKIKELARKAIELINLGDIEGVGKLLDQAWEFKKLSNPGVNSPAIEKIYQTGKKYGALGFKICGAGGGGYGIFMVYPEKREKFIENMIVEGFEHWDFSICWNGLETRILND